MADEVRERVRQGELDALSDPSFLLHLLADGPTAGWWLEGIEQCAWTIVADLAPSVSDFDYWSAQQGFPSYLVLARRLRSALPSACPEIDTALATLETYST